MVGHFSFTPIYCSGVGDGCGDAFYDQDALVEVLRTSVLSWLEHTRGRPGAIEQLPEGDALLTWQLDE